MTPAPKQRALAALAVPLVLPAVSAAPAPGDPPGPAAGFAHWESPHVHPLELTPDGARLLAVNTADGRLEVFDAAGPELVPVRAIPVGVDPVGVRARNEREAWVVDHVGDSVAVVDLAAGRVRATLPTDDEPCDVVFAGVPERAFVSCSQANTLLVFDPADLSVPPERVVLEAEDPRVLAVSPDGRTVYAAVFESGNGTTVLGGGGLVSGGYPPDVVGDPAGPHGGVNPPPNTEPGAGAAFEPPLADGNAAPPAVALIVRQDELGAWRDDTGADWTELVSGSLAPLSGRPVGWQLHDRDVAVIDAETLAVSWIERLMNLDMALAVHPVDGRLAVVGTDATNEVRFEPNVRGTFVRSLLALVDPATGATDLVDLNAHLDDSASQVPQGERDLALGEPRAVAWSAGGTRAWVAGLGSNNLVVLDATGARAGLAPTVEVAEGPTGIALHEELGRLYVLGRFEAAISVVDLATELEIARVPFHDATPAAVREGRRLLFDSHATSGLGQASCASCHVDARTDRLAWDLGDPSGAATPTAGMNLGGDHPLLPSGFPSELHPMKGPMLTQTLQDVVGQEPFHWRGDRAGIEEFAGAYVSLLGDDAAPSPAEMQQLEDYLATLRFPPNPFRTLANELPDDLPLPGHATTGRFGPAGEPLPNGDAARGLELFRPPNLFDGEVACTTCHTLPTGSGPDFVFADFHWQPVAPGPDGERHGMLTMDGTQVEPMAVPQLRNLYERTGFTTIFAEGSRAGFGFSHNGSADTLERFVSQPLFHVTSDQDVADLVAFLLAFSGSDLPQGDVANGFHAPGAPSLDTHAAVGARTTLGTPQADPALLGDLLALADAGAVGLAAWRPEGGRSRGYAYLGGGAWQADRAGEATTTAELEALAAPGAELVLQAVPAGSETRLAVDRDGDGHLDGDEHDALSDPASAACVPAPCEDEVPAAPAGLTAASAGPGVVELSWDAGGHACRVERAPAGSGAFEPVAFLPGGVTRHADSGLDCGASHDYRVVARTCAGDSPPAAAAASAGGCDALTADVPSISVSVGGRQTLSLRAPLATAGSLYIVLGSLSGSSPGVDLGAWVLPLNPDPWFALTLEGPNLPPLVHTLAYLDATARGKAAIQLPPASPPPLVGLSLVHAFVVVDAQLQASFTSSAVELATVP